MSAYYQEVRKLEGTFDGLELTHILRNDNNWSEDGFQADPDFDRCLLHQPTISEEAPEPVNKLIEAEVFAINPDWITLYLNYLLRDELPEDRAEAERIAQRSRRYVVVGGEELYHRGTSGILMRCISEEDGRKLLKEIHSGICGNHAASRTLVGKAYRQGFFWPTAVTDADELIRKCEGCQFRSADTRASARAADNSNHLAFRSLGPRHGWPPAESTRWLHTPLRRYRQIHQVD